MLQCIAVLLRVAVCCGVVQCGVVCRSVLQLLQCAVVCCSVLPCVAPYRTSSCYLKLTFVRPTIMCVFVYIYVYTHIYNKNTGTPCTSTATHCHTQRNTATHCNNQTHCRTSKENMYVYVYIYTYEDKTQRWIATGSTTQQVLLLHLEFYSISFSNLNAIGSFQRNVAKEA